MSSERTKTDDSLRIERKNTDVAHKAHLVSAERDADAVVRHARVVADAVLGAARLKADHRSIRLRGPVEADAVVGERAKADRDLRGERATADIALRSDRKDQAKILAALMVRERAATDAYLLTERARSDDAVTHRDDFLGMVAHEAGNLLNLVVLDLEQLRRGNNKPDPQVSSAAANRIQRSVERMNRLIGDLLDVTSIDSGKLAMAPAKGDAAALMAEATEMLSPAALAKGVCLSAEVPAGPLLAEFDHARMLQVFVNLISNSIKFTPSGGKITILVEAAPGTLQFCISDTGVGIPAPMLEAIFERFWQAGENARKGLGLGLYISKCIVEAHLGRLWCESEPGKGSQLYFTLPVPN